MAHSYSNFTDAFADLCDKNTVYRTYIEDCYDKADTAIDYANAGNYKNGIKYNSYAIKALATAIDSIIHGQYFEWYDSWFYESIYWASKEGGDVVDMAAILDAMWNAYGGQTMTFILYIDAMRGSISEKSVFTPYLESYLRHFLG